MSGTDIPWSYVDPRCLLVSPVRGADCRPREGGRRVDEFDGRDGAAHGCRGRGGVGYGGADGNGLRRYLYRRDLCAVPGAVRVGDGGLVAVLFRGAVSRGRVPRGADRQAVDGTRDHPRARPAGRAGEFVGRGRDYRNHGRDASDGGTLRPIGPAACAARGAGAG